MRDYNTIRSIFRREAKLLYLYTSFLLTANHTAERETPFDAVFSHTCTLWQCWQANNRNVLLLEKAHHQW